MPPEEGVPTLAVLLLVGKRDTERDQPSCVAGAAMGKSPLQEGQGQLRGQSRLGGTKRDTFLSLPPSQKGAGSNA